MIRKVFFEKIKGKEVFVIWLNRKHPIKKL